MSSTIDPSVYHQILSRKKKWAYPDLEGANIVVDALTFCNRIAYAFSTFLQKWLERQNSGCQDGRVRSVYAEIMGQCTQEIRFLKLLKPTSIKFIVSSTFDEEKLKRRTFKSLRRMKEQIVCPNILPLLLEAVSRFPEVSIQYTSEYFENEALNYFYKRNLVNERILVFTKYADILEYDTPFRERILLCATPFKSRKRSQWDTINLISYTDCKDLITGNIQPPTPNEHFTIEYEQWPIRDLCEILCFARKQKRFLYMAGLVWYKFDIKQPHNFSEVGLNLQKIAFGQIIETYCKDVDLQSTDVEMWIQQDYNFVPINLRPFTGSDLQSEVDKVRGLNLPQLLERQFQGISDEHKIPNCYISCLTEMVSDLVNQKIVREAKLDGEEELELSVCIGYLKAFLMAARLFEEMYGPLYVTRVEFDCTPGRLKAYINDFYAKTGCDVH